jgi:phage tail sheath gpL-like
MVAPLAVDPSNPRPGLALSVALLRGASSPGLAGLRAVIISPPATSGGDLPVNEARTVYSKEDVEVAAGRCLGYFALQSFVENYPQALVDLVCCTESAGVAASGTLTFAGTPTSNCSWRVWIQGVAVDVFWNVGEAATAARDNNFPRINQKGTDLFCVASAGTAGAMNLLARSKGTAGNDIRLRVKQLTGTGATLTPSGATLTGGTVEVDMTAALAALSKEYDFIVPCLSNVDAQASGGSTNAARVATHIDANVTGFNSRLQQAVYASTGSIAQAKTGAIARNHTNLEHVLSVSDESLPCEIAAAEAGDRMRRRAKESNANRVLQPLKRVRGSADVNGDQPSDPEVIDALNNGVSLMGYSASGAPIILRSVTTHSLDVSGNPDRRCFDVNEVDALYDYSKDLRTGLPQEFMSPDGQVKIAKNRKEGDEPNPEGVVEERDAKAWVIRRTINFWVPKGVIDGVKFQSSVDDGTLICEIDGADENQLDIFVPAKAFKILAKISLVVAKVG